MPMLTRLSSGLALLCGSLVWVMSLFPAGAASITTQPRCAGPDGYCLSFGPADTIPVIRSINFTAPKAGTAQVSFHGSLYCYGFSNLSSDNSFRVAYVSQIVNKSNEVPDVSKAGSLRHEDMMVLDINDHSFLRSTTFNLASTRAFTIAGAGRQRYYFKIMRQRHDHGICYVYNATFTIVFI